ncbi:hypothetical protein [Hephaestia caeni]|nr:hypothetical protein [Hephaestia caeni]
MMARVREKAERPRYAIGPLAEVVDEAAGVIATAGMIDTWLAVARAGDEFIYASRAWLPPGAAGAACARSLAEMGLVHLKQRPIAGTAQRNYVMERSSRAIDAATRGTRTPVSDKAPIDGEAAVMNAVMPALRRAARWGRPCPTDVQLASRARVPVDEIARVLAAMVEMNWIRIERVKAPTLRQVTIVATGHRTGLVREDR